MKTRISFKTEGKILEEKKEKKPTLFLLWLIKPSFFIKLPLKSVVSSSFHGFKKVFIEI